MTSLASVVIRLCRKLLPNSMFCSCRFFPTCSSYAAKAIERHGLFPGAVRAAWRILKCHPLSRGGFDPVR